MLRILKTGFLSALLVLLTACASLPPVSPVPARYVAAPGAESRVFQSPDRLTLFGQWWVPAQPPKAVVLLVHGTLVHSGFYAPWAEELRAHGYAVFGIDLRGWGQSQGHGRRGYVGDYDEYERDLDIAWQEARSRYPGVPLYLQGESLGGAVVLLESVEHRHPVDGLILNAPAVKPNPGVGFLRAPGPLGEFNLWAAAEVGKLGPDMPFLPIVRWHWALGWVLTDKEGQQRFIDDPACTHTWLPAAYVTALQKVSSRLKKNLAEVHEPVLILQGTKDVLVPASSSSFTLLHVASRDKTLKLYPGMNHATLHDVGRQKVWADIVDWLDRHAAQYRPDTTPAPQDAAAPAAAQGAAFAGAVPAS